MGGGGRETTWIALRRYSPLEATNMCDMDDEELRETLLDLQAPYLIR